MIPLPNLTLAAPGGSAGPSNAASGADSGGDTGAVMFSDGAFQFGADDQSSPLTTYANPVSGPSEATPASNSYQSQAYGYALPQGLSTGTAASGLSAYLPWLLIGGVALCALLLLRR